MKKLLVGAFLVVSSMLYGSDIDCLDSDNTTWKVKEELYFELAKDTSSPEKVDRLILLGNDIIINLVHIRNEHKDIIPENLLKRLDNIIALYKAQMYDMLLLKAAYKSEAK